jgi:hypothetical protein
MMKNSNEHRSRENEINNDEDCNLLFGHRVLTGPERRTPSSGEQIAPEEFGD